MQIEESPRPVKIGTPIRFDIFDNCFLISGRQMPSSSSLTSMKSSFSSCKNQIYRRESCLDLFDFGSAGTEVERLWRSSALHMPTGPTITGTIPRTTTREEIRSHLVRTCVLLPPVS